MFLFTPRQLELTFCLIYHYAFGYYYGLPLHLLRLQSQRFLPLAGISYVSQSKAPEAPLSHPQTTTTTYIIQDDTSLLTNMHEASA